VSDFVATKFDDAHAGLPRAAAIPDRTLGGPHITVAAQVPYLELDVRREPASPFPEALEALEPFSGLRKLQSRIS
jgi:hypothetical protein